MLPQQGDKITAIDGEVHRGVVDEGGNGLAPGYFRWHTGDRNSPAPGRPWAMRAYREDTEGLDWIRGWHEEGSDELNALLAAHKLAASLRDSAFVTVGVGVMTMSGPAYFAREPNPAFDFDPTR